MSKSVDTAEARRASASPGDVARVARKRGSWDEVSLLGIDVGFSVKRPTTGMAWCIGHEFGAAKTHSDWARRQAVLPPAGRYAIVAIDGPLPPSGAPPDVDRRCERTFIRGAFATRCKPGLSHFGRGRALRAAALQTASDASSLLALGSAFPGPHIMPEVAVVEAFPNAFLGVLLPDEVYVTGGFKKGKKFDGLYDHAVRLGRLDLTFEALEWRNPRLLERMKLERDHERRAAFICLLTAALAHTGKAHVVGDELGGWFWLPPLNLWAGWAREALSETWLGV